ncbi:acylamino-acid-releasing enzyme-like isoform X2 [Zophobas morio]|uniref:acylamino-acid-releasing enzyme-like isoform X2 n=1 Tax=Zophobas morio TaxID=2755281 RepID=UPI0030832206
MVKATWSQADLVLSKNRTYTVSYSTDGHQVYPIERKNMLFERLSPCGKFLAIARETTIGLEDKKRGYAFDIWTENRLKDTIIATCELHGPIYTDSFFGCFNWSSDSKKIVYCAEKKQTKFKSLWWPKIDLAGVKTERQDKEDFLSRKSKFHFKEDWGELYDKKAFARLFVVDIERGCIEEVEGIPEDLCSGDASWTSDNSGLVFTGVPLDASSKRLGLLYCYNRRHGLYFFSHSTEQHPSSTLSVKNLTPDIFASRSGRFNPSYERLAFLFVKECVSHNTAHCLGVLDWRSKEILIVLDTVYTAPYPESFPGLYVTSLPQRCWVQLSKQKEAILLTSQWRSLSAALLVELNTSTVWRCTTNAASISSLRAFDAVGNFLLLSSSTPSSPPGLVLLKVTDNSKDERLTFDSKALTDLEQLDIKWGIYPVSLPHSPKETFEIIVTSPKGKCGPFPLIICPHGGPHSAYSAAFDERNAFLNNLGYIVCYVNYRGSTGFGLHFLNSLVGEYGRLDVEDVQAAREYCCANFDVDRKKVAIIGGSHGGWLGAHCISRYPQCYQACVLHNPVTNLVGQVATSDIPDWAYAAVGLPYRTCPSAEEISLLYKNSPVANDLSCVTTPTLFTLGGKDRRVPPSQGLQLYYALLARSVPVKTFWYPEDSHPIDSVDAHYDSLVQIALWLDKYLFQEH